MKQALARYLTSRRVKQVVIVIVIVATLGFFAYYLWNNPDSLHSLLTIDPLSITLLLLGYTGIVLSNAFVLHYSLLYLKKSTGAMENIALTGYSSIVNFFGPLQSGPGVRAIYLKTKHKVRLRDFLLTTFIFYGFFAFFNALIVFFAWSGQFPNALFSGALGLVVSIIFLIFVARLLPKKTRVILTIVKKIRLNTLSFWMIAVGALLLLLSTLFIYSIELDQVQPGYAFGQKLVYTAAANLALFVSLTPGALGFRESFLYVSQQLHGISPESIVLASVIDRAINVVFLLLLFVVLLALTGKRGLRSFAKQKPSTNRRQREAD